MGNDLFERKPESIEEAEAIDKELLRMADKFFVNNPSYTIDSTEESQEEEAVDVIEEPEEEESIIYDPATGGVFRPETAQETTVKKKEDYHLGEFEKTMQRILFLKMNDKVNDASGKMIESLSEREVPYYIKQEYIQSVNKKNKEMRDIYSVVALEEDILNSKKLPDAYQQELKSDAYNYISTLFDFADNFKDYKKTFELLEKHVTELSAEVETLQKEIKTLKGE